MIDQIVTVEVEGCCRDPVLWFGSAEGVFRKNDHIADVDMTSTELAEQYRAAGSDDDELYAVVSDRINGRVSGERSGEDRCVRRAFGRRERGHSNSPRSNDGAH